MTILVLGGTGFIGRHLCELLHRERISAVVSTRSPDLGFLCGHSPTIRGIALDDPGFWDDVRQARMIVHLGTISRPGTNWQDPTYEIEDNVAAATSMFRRILDINPSCHIVYASSGGQIYGPGHSRPIAEDAIPAPITSYALGKLLVEQILAFFARTDGATVTVLRIANPVGRWQIGRRHGFVSAAIEAQRTGRTLSVFGDGHNVRDYFDVDDLAELILDLIRRPTPQTGTFNIGSGVETTELEVMAAIERLTKRPVPHAFAPARPFDLRYAVLNADQATEKIGWKPRAGLDDIIRKLMRLTREEQAVAAS